MFECLYNGTGQLKPEFLDPIVHKKGWGREIWYVNNEKYCLKRLCFDKEAEFSLHFHAEKDETWIVEEGHFILTTLDFKTTKKRTISLFPGNIIRIKQGLPHKLKASLEGGVILEVSTTHFDHDSYRIEKGDSQ